MTIIQHKRGSSDKWTTLDPILAIGEIGYESDTGNFKIGDGSSNWSSLAYFMTSTGEVPVGSGTVTSVDITLPTGLVVSGNPITDAGTLAVAYDTGYEIPTTAKQIEWDTAYSWGDHAAAGYVSATTNSAITITNNTSSTNTTTGALKVTGGVGIQENLNVGGNLVVAGTASINVTTIDAPIFTLGGDTAPGSDDNKDRGIAFRWHNGVSAKIGFFGFDDSAQQFTFIPDATITSEVVSGSTGTIAANLNGNATSADTLSTPRYLWGQVFDGTDNVSGSLTDVGDISSPEAIFSISTTSVTTALGNRIDITGGTTSNTTGTGGYVAITGGSATSSTGANFGGNVNIAAGASTLSASGTGGSVSILAGNGNTKGIINIGTSNTSAITIGASGITTTIAGTLSASLNALTISSPLSGTSYNGSSAVSIGLSTGYGDTQNPYGSKSINTILAGPAGGVSGFPTFRSLVSADIPDLSGTYVAVSGGTAPISDQVKTVANGTNASFYPTFVDANNGTATAESVYTDAGLIYNPSSNTLTVGGNLVVGGVSIQVEGATADSFETLLTVTDPTADRTITFPDATGTVALTSDISGFVTSVTGTSPIASSGGTTPAISLATSYGDTQNPYGTKTTNYVLAGPAGGPNALPSFRALVAADIPSLSGIYLPLTGGTLTGNLAINNGASTAITTTGATASVFNTTATTLNIGKAATVIDMGATTGSTQINNKLVTATGTATLAPIDFPAGTLLTTPETGALEFDGKAFYSTPTNGGRSVNVGTHYVALNTTNSLDMTTTTPQSLFGTTNYGITVDAGTTYEYEISASVQHSIGSGSSTAIFTITSSTVTGSPTVAFAHNLTYASNTTGFTTASTPSVVRTTGSTTVGASLTGPANRYITVVAKGIIRITGTGTAKIRPTLAAGTGATDSSGIVQIGSFMKMTPIGNGTVTTIGNWA